MSPQGYLGRGFAARHPELGLPARLWDWNDDHRLVALAKRGEDCVGNLIVGDESLHRFISAEMVETARERFPELAHRAAVGEGGSSAGGEHPKFGAYAGGRHVLVKFASGEGDVARRWRDLLWCEWRTLQVLTEEGFSVTKATCFDVEGHRFLEAERFDRAGERGRRGLLSLYSIDNEYFGSPDNWTKAALRLQSSGRLSTEDARTLRWWDTFGELAGNTDRHFGNVSFFPEVGGQLRLAPAYDMLPMILAPSLTEVVERPFAPRPPTSDNLDVWPQAAKAAVRYWGLVAAEASLQESVRRYAEVAGRTVETLLGRVEPAH